MESQRGRPALFRSLAVCGLGAMDSTVIRHVAEHISTRSCMPYTIIPEMDIPAYAFDEKRGQYNSKVILKRLMQFPHDCIRLLAVTQVDLFVPILKYVFGLAQVGGPCALISTYRLRPEFYGHDPDRDLFMARIGKTAMHELGHSLGLTHCRNRRCVMYSSTRINDTDLKRSDFCPTCFELFRWHLEKCRVEPNPYVPQN